MRLTHKEKILFPKDKLTKEDLVTYYRKVARRMLPLLKNRPISMHRFPQGIAQTGFFQKQAPKTAPVWAHVVKVKRKNGTMLSMLLCLNLKTLLWLSNQNCITPHIWLSCIDKPDLPDRMIFDLDPDSKNQFATVVKGALYLKKVLEKRNLRSFVMTTGSRGLHVVVPLQRKYSFAKVRAFAKKIAAEVVLACPQEFTMEIRKSKRQNKVYIDTLRNGPAQTTVAPYAARALEGAPVATPLFWKELENPKLRADSYTVQNMGNRLRKNPWVGIEKGNCLKTEEGLA